MKLRYAIFLTLPFLVGAMSPKETQDVQAENCSIAKNKLRTLTEKPRVRKMNTQGQLEVLSPEALHTEIDKVKKDIEQYCGPKKDS